MMHWITSPLQNSLHVTLRHFLRLLTGPLLPGQKSSQVSVQHSPISYFLSPLLLLKFHFVVPNNKFHQFLNF